VYTKSLLCHDDRRMKEQVVQHNLYEEVGQLFITGIAGQQLTVEEKAFIGENNIGGVILFAHNYEAPGQLAELINSIQALRKEYPLFIAVDQEGGRVQRFKAPFMPIPPMFSVGQSQSPKLCFELHSLIAQQLKSVGVNLSFGPVCDVWSNPANKVIGDRAFSHDVHVVEQFVSAAIRGLQTQGLMSCAKHFPGHGDTTKDSHYDLPIVKTSEKTFKEREVLPFVKAIKSRVPFVMMAHLIVDIFDEKYPSSLSSKTHDYLRKELKYENIIISDDMNMKAITDHFGAVDSVRLAFEAGTDILEYRDFVSTKNAYQALLDMLKSKEVEFSTLKPKLKRIARIKKDYLSDYQPIYIPSISDYFKESFYSQVLKQFTVKV
jgi:beta-N-acetylhexosaminidase